MQKYGLGIASLKQANKKHKQNFPWHEPTHIALEKAIYA